MTNRQWLWLSLWVLAFFILFCTWDKTNMIYKERLLTKNNEQPSIISETIGELPKDNNQSSVNVIDKISKDKSLSSPFILKLSKIDDFIKIKGSVPKQENKSELKDNFMQFFSQIDDNDLKVNKNVKEDLFAIDLFENLAEDFAKFDRGDISYDGKHIMIDGITSNSVAYGSIKKKIALLKEKGLDVNNTLKLENEPKYSDDENSKKSNNNINTTDLQKQEQESNITTDTKKEDQKISQTKIDTIMHDKRVQFLYAKDILSKKSKILLDEIAKILKEYNKTNIEIDGYTDSDGTQKRNLRLSQRRANAVKRYLIKKGIDKDRLKAVGYGETNPIVPNTTRENKRKNRRVEFKIIGEIK